MTKKTRKTINVSIAINKNCVELLFVFAVYIDFVNKISLRYNFKQSKLVNIERKKLKNIVVI